MAQSIIPAEFHAIHSDSNYVNIFIKSIYDHFGVQNLLERSNQLLPNSTDPYPWKEANKIDNQIGIAIELTKKRCKLPQRPPWFKKIHYVSLIIRFREPMEIGDKINQNQIKSLEEIWKILPELPTITPNLKILQEKVQQAQMDLRASRMDAVNTRKEFLQEL